MDSPSAPSCAPRRTFTLLCALCALMLGPLPAHAQQASEESAVQAIEDAERALPPRHVEEGAEAQASGAEAQEKDARSAPSAADEVVAEEVVDPATQEDLPEAPERAALPSAQALFEGSPATPDAVEEEPEEEVVAADAARHEATPVDEAPAPALVDTLSPQSASMVTMEVMRQIFDDVQGLDLRKQHDLRPYLDAPEWEMALGLMREQECKKALATITPLLEAHQSRNLEHPPTVRFAVAKMQLCGGEKRAGQESMEALAGGKDATARLAARALGRKVKDPESGEKAAATRTLKQQLAGATILARQAEKLEEALEVLAGLRQSEKRGWSWYRVRLTEVEILERAARIDDARHVWYSIYLRTRDWRSGDKIEDMIEAFEKRHPEHPVIGMADRIDRMRELVARGRYSQARKLNASNAKLLRASRDETRGWGLYRQGLEAERKKDRQDAIALFEKAEELIEHDAMRARLYFGWARALRRVDRDSDAIALYDRLCAEYPNETICPDAMYEAGRLLQYHNKHDEARQHFYKLVTLHPFHRDVDDALWRGAFSAYLQEDWDHAEAPLRHLLEHHADKRDASELTMGLKAMYWLGVVALKRGDRGLASVRLQDTINAGPLTWYGRLAAARMKSMGIQPMIALPPTRLTVDDLASFERISLPYHPRLEEAVELIRVGLYEEAAAEVGRQLRSYPRPEGAERLLANLHLVMGRPDLAHWNMKSLLGEHGPTLRDVRDWGCAFPLHFMEFSHRWGAQYGVDPFLVQAIIRQESGFRPAVKSHAGAVGLMQLMPGTARYTARVFLEGAGEAYRRRDLVTPEKNIRLGTMYIRVHTAHASDNVALALAGYNAGPAPLQRWIEQYGDRELDAFVESITYREARGYVRKVMTSYITYSGLYGDGGLPELPLTMPKALRRWGDVPEVEKATKEDTVSSVDPLWEELWSGERG